MPIIFLCVLAACLSLEMIVGGGGGDADRGCSDRISVLLGLLACQNHLSHCL